MFNYAEERYLLATFNIQLSKYLPPQSTKYCCEIKVEDSNRICNLAFLWRKYSSEILVICLLPHWVVICSRI